MGVPAPSDGAFTLRLGALYYIGASGVRRKLEIRDIRATDRIIDIKNKIVDDAGHASRRGISCPPSAPPPSDVVLFFANKELDDAAALQDYGICKDSTVMAIVWYDIA
eukprot:CAMPEP_0176069086 /NCGR_PEP_ID=MMETSP0120_2-20121206/34491_1 /TAXON_ID=160619 /ORGANISM="Kryptoperidinium foliaceum, Strain CCMP 1326" /LENGTH=107 /DNA_ID=CAMNT_0017402715 /DNA_START=1 /DNA_END=324 /DNA_ORIENTATION=+